MNKTALFPITIKTISRDFDLTYATAGMEGQPGKIAMGSAQTGGSFESPDAEQEVTSPVNIPGLTERYWPR